MKLNFKQLIIYIIGATFLINGVVFAGTLTASVDINTTNFITLNELYNKIINNTYSTSTHSISTSTSPAASMRTLTEIYNAIPTLVAGNFTSNKTIMGITGTYSLTNLIPSNVRAGITYGTSSIGTFAGNEAEWYATDNPIGEGSWNQAGIYCAGRSSVGGIKDGMPWRLPTVGELQAKYNETHSLPDGFMAEYYWSGGSYNDPVEGDNSYNVNMGTGSRSGDGRGLQLRSRCAR